MANKKTSTIPVNKERFMKVLKECGKSIRSLGSEEAYRKIGRTEKTIRRNLNDGAMSPDLLYQIAKYLGVHPDLLSGKLDMKHYNHDFLDQMYKSRLTVKNYPFVLKLASEIDYEKYFEDTLARYNVTMDQFRNLDPEERVLFRYEMDYAIAEVIAHHIHEDALGYKMDDTVAYIGSMVGDDDPTSYYMTLEGIGISEDKLREMDEDEAKTYFEDQREFEEKMKKKYGISDADSNVVK